MRNQVGCFIGTGED